MKFFNIRTLFFIILFFSAFSSTTLLAQLPGMNEETKKKTEVVEKKEDAPKDEKLSFPVLYNRFLGEESPYRVVILTVATLLILLALKQYTTRSMMRYVREKAFLEDNAQAFLKTWKRLWNFTIAVLVIIAMSGSLRLLGLTAGFFGMMLGWSLQQPVTGIAAWLMIVLKRPFKIGDRVVIAGMTGDVTGITLTHVILNQVGGSVSGEERSGRGILVPNAILFQHTIINYTLEQKYMLDEVPVRITFDSDWELAKKVMIQCALEVTKDLVKDVDAEPFIRTEFLEFGVLARLRYNTIPVKRQEISTEIIEKLMIQFKKNYPRIKFAVPAQFIKHEQVTE